MRPRVSPRADLRHRGRAGGAVWGTGLRRCSGPVFYAGAERGHAARRRRRFRGRASRGGLRYCLQVGVRDRVPLWGVSFAVSLSPSALMTSCASSSVRDQGRVLRGAAGSAIVVSLCLRAGGAVRLSRGW